MTCQAVEQVLEETIQALASLDRERLRILEEEVTELAESKLIADESGINAVLAKKRVLELVLHGSASGLDALNRLHGRNTGDLRDLWER